MRPFMEGAYTYLTNLILNENYVVILVIMEGAYTLTLFYYCDQNVVILVIMEGAYTPKVRK